MSLDVDATRLYAVLIGGPEDGSIKPLEGEREAVPTADMGSYFPTEPLYRTHVPEVFRLGDGTAYELMEFLPWWMEKAPALSPGQFPYVHHRYNRGGPVGSR